MHVLRSERVGALWCGVAVLACLMGRRMAGALHPLENWSPWRSADVLAGLGEPCRGQGSPGFNKPVRRYADATAVPTQKA